VIGRHIRLKHAHGNDSNSVPLVMCEDRGKAILGFAYDFSYRSTKLRYGHSANHHWILQHVYLVQLI
jgi:hypothetical protein